MKLNLQNAQKLYKLKIMTFILLHLKKKNEKNTNLEMVIEGLREKFVGHIGKY